MFIIWIKMRTGLDNIWGEVKQGIVDVVAGGLITYFVPMYVLATISAGITEDFSSKEHPHWKLANEYGNIIQSCYKMIMRRPLNLDTV